MKRRIWITLLILGVTLSVRCTSIYTLQRTPDKGERKTYLYSGSRADLDYLVHDPYMYHPKARPFHPFGEGMLTPTGCITAVDLPFSFILDTLLLPFTIPLQIHSSFSKSGGEKELTAAGWGPLLTNAREGFSWREAAEQCASIGMRLPSLSEIVALGHTEQFERLNGYGAYWTQDTGNSLPVRHRPGISANEVVFVVISELAHIPGARTDTKQTPVFSVRGGSKGTRSYDSRSLIQVRCHAIPYTIYAFSEETKPQHRSVSAHPLIEAAAQGNFHEFRDLLGPGAKVDDQDEWGTSALMAAADASSTKIAQLLLDSGASVNLRDREGKTALHRAVLKGSLPLLRLLLDKGADPTARDKSGKSPMDLTQEPAILMTLTDALEKRKR